MKLQSAIDRVDVNFALRGRGQTYALTEQEFNAAMRAVESLQSDSKLLTTGEVAKLLGVSAKTVARMLDAGKIPFVRNGNAGHRLVSYRNVMEYVEKRQRRQAKLERARVLADSMGAYDLADV